MLDRASVPDDEGLWLPECHAIHTIGMRLAIDVMFVDSEVRVLRICRNIKPNRLFLSCRHARAVLELGAGAINRTDVAVGDRLELISAPAPASRANDPGPA